MTEFFDDLDKRPDEELIAIADGKIPWFLSAKSTTTRQDVMIEAKAILHKRQKREWERFSKVESEVPNQPSNKKEKEQKFGILNSLGQAAIDFPLYSSGLGTDVSVGVVFLDIDDFKSLNVQFMESIVDQNILIPFQQMLSSACLYRGDAYRHGGEEFLILLPNHTAEEVMQFAEHLRQRIEAKDFSVGESSVRITVSIGIAFCPKHGVELQDLIEKANRAEHEAKAKGKNRIEAYEEGSPNPRLEVTATKSAAAPQP
jgi:diguanylate cyclase (GGDEF)-like protein